MTTTNYQPWELGALDPIGRSNKNSAELYDDHEQRQIVVQAEMEMIDVAIENGGAIPGPSRGARGIPEAMASGCYWNDYSRTIIGRAYETKQATTTESRLSQRSKIIHVKQVFRATFVSLLPGQPHRLPSFPFGNLPIYILCMQ